MSNGPEATLDCWAITNVWFKWSTCEIQGMDPAVYFGIIIKCTRGFTYCECSMGWPTSVPPGVEVTLDPGNRSGTGTYIDAVNLGACAGADSSPGASGTAGEWHRKGCAGSYKHCTGGDGKFDFAGPFKWSDFQRGSRSERIQRLEDVIFDSLGGTIRGGSGGHGGFGNLQRLCDSPAHSTNEPPLFNKTEEDLQQFLSGPGEEDDEELTLFCLSYLSLNGHVQFTWSTNDDGSMFIAYDCVLNIDTLEGCSKINLCDDIKNGPGGWPSEQEGDAGEGQLTIHFNHRECLDCGGCGKEGVEVNGRTIHKSGASTGGKGELPGGLAGEWLIIFKLWKDARRSGRPSWDVQKDSNDFFRALAASIGPAYPLSCPPQYMCLGGSRHITKGDGWPKLDWLEFEKRMDGSNWRPGDERSRPVTWLEVAEFMEGLGLSMHPTTTKKPRALGDGTNPKDSPDEDW